MSVVSVDSAFKAPSAYKLIVGVDYGTTFSGVSYVVSSKTGIEDIEVMSRWPNQCYNTWKTPSKIAYAHENNRIDRNHWGFEVKAGFKQYSWTKLLLDSKSELTEYDDPLLQDPYGDGLLKLPDNKTAQDVTEDYLRELYNFIIKTLKRKLSSGVFSTMPVEFWITMPAIWSHQAQAATQSAAKRAGFGSRPCDEVNMITEPEAAALAAMKPHVALTAIDPVLPGETLLVCDCGGGTVDITTYSIIETKPALKYKEICRGTGGKCGATSIDRNFNEWMIEKFGNAYSSLPLTKRGTGSRFMDAFEIAKRNFGTVEDERPFEIPAIDLGLPASSIYYDDDEHSVKLSKSSMAGLFDPCIKELISLVEAQSQLVKEKSGKVLDRFILVGGFGESEYLNRRLKDWCKKNKIKRFTCPENCQTAVVKGAALRGLEGLKPTVTIARKHYGWSWASDFREGIDDEKDSFLDIWDNRKMCLGRMEWVIHKGQELDESTVAASEVCESLEHFSSKHDTTLELFECTLVDPPERVEHFRVQPIGTINTHFRGASSEVVESQYNQRLQKTVWQYSFQVEVKFRAKEGVLTFRSMAYGKERGRTQIAYE